MSRGFKASDVQKCVCVCVCVGGGGGGFIDAKPLKVFVSFS